MSACVCIVSHQALNGARKNAPKLLPSGFKGTQQRQGPVPGELRKF